MRKLADIQNEIFLYKEKQHEAIPFILMSKLAPTTNTIKQNIIGVADFRDDLSLVAKRRIPIDATLREKLRFTLREAK